MDVLVVLFILFVILAIITIVGHVIWVIAREFLKLLFGTRYESEQPPSIGTPGSPAREARRANTIGRCPRAATCRTMAPPR